MLGWESGGGEGVGSLFLFLFLFLQLGPGADAWRLLMRGGEKEAVDGVEWNGEGEVVGSNPYLPTTYIGM